MPFQILIWIFFFNDLQEIRLCSGDCHAPPLGKFAKLKRGQFGDVLRRMFAVLPLLVLLIFIEFPFVVLLAKKGEFEEGEPWKSILAEDFAEDQDAPTPETEPGITEENTIAQDAPESPCTPSEGTGDAIIAPGEIAAQASAGATENGNLEEGTEIPENIAKMTTPTS